MMAKVDFIKPSTSNNNLAVQCQDLTFSYGKVSVLNSASITITTGQIFALLGPSGCGKTTLLRSVLGRLKPQSGSVLVFGLPPDSESAKVPGPDVGFMPQEVGLVQQFTIENTVTYFGRLFNMSLEEIRNRIDFLTKLLKLPDKNRQISHLSGGEQRRVSFAVAIVHQPKLVVLDEPTVGQDSMLRDTIWRHLQEMSQKQQVTILITTHYVEEAKSADIVSMMRRGKILAQENPYALTKQLSCTNLDDAFIKLFQEDNKKVLLSRAFSMSTNATLQDQLIRVINCFKIKPSLHKMPRLDKIGIILKKDITNLKKNLSLLIIFLIFPILIMIVLGTSGYGKDLKNIPVALYNGEANGDGMSKKFVDKLDLKMFNIHSKSRLEDAVEMVRQGKTWAAISIHPNFSSSFEARILEAKDVTDEEIDESNIKLYVDTSHGFSEAIQFLMTAAYHQFLDEFLITEHGYNPRTADIPINVEGVYMINKNKNNFFTDLSAVAYYGMMAMIVYVFPMFMITNLITLEREQSLIERSLVAGVRSSEFLIAHLLTLLVLLVVLVALLMITSFVIFDTFMTGNPVTVFFMLYTIGCQGIAFGLFVSTFFTDRVAITGLAGCVVFPLLLTSGIIFPIEAMPWFLVKLVKFTPLTLPVDALRSVAFRGWTMSYFGVSMGFSVNALFTLIFLFMAFVLF